MTLDYADFTKASTFIHLAQGLGLLALGAAEAYAADNPGRRVRLAGAAALLLAAAAVPLLILALPGGWSLEQMRLALDVRRGFLVFVALACLFGAAGLSRLTQVLTDKEAGGWRTMFFSFLALSALLYFYLGQRVNEEAAREVAVWHGAAGATLLLAVAAGAAAAVSGRRALRLAWAALLLAAGLQLAVYREKPDAFGLRLVTITSEAGTPAPAAGPKTNATPADKERPAR